MNLMSTTVTLFTKRWLKNLKSALIDSNTQPPPPPALIKPINTPHPTSFCIYALKRHTAQVSNTPQPYIIYTYNIISGILQLLNFLLTEHI
jgi:hypothetical protein